MYKGLIRYIKNTYRELYVLKNKVLYSRIKKSNVSKSSFVGKRCVIENTTIGRYSYIGRDCEFLYTNIGSFCSVGNRVKVIIGDHPTSKFVSTYPAFYDKENFPTKYIVDDIFCGEKYNGLCSNKYEGGRVISIGSDVWIGDDVRILAGIRIGHGAVVGAGALVTKDVAPYSIVMGLPAKEVRKRFTEREIQELISAKWWEKELDWIMDNKELFSNIKRF